MKRCPYCAEKMQGIAIVCPHCGRDYPRSGEFAETEDPLGNTKPEFQPGKGRKILQGVLIFVLILSGWIFVYIKGNKDQLEKNNYKAAIATQSFKLANNQVELANLAGTQTAQDQEKASNQVIQSTLEALATQQASTNIAVATELVYAKSQQVKYCKEGDGLSWDYTNDETILAQLKTFSENLGGKPTKATYTLPWNIPYLAVYTINTKYVL